MSDTSFTDGWTALFADECGSQTTVAAAAAMRRLHVAPRLVAEAATAEDARLLAIRRGDPLLGERRLINDEAGNPLEMTESRYVGSRYALGVEFHVELPS